ncbi:MAG: xanthine dehydrogenase family protein subunit M [Acidobacteriia bacterium]|nr:xanthine dehydrogenase family protein subunit M [Terriglobia bacterium]
MQAFEYAAPKNLAEALVLLEQKGTNARIMSGGTDLIVQVRENRRDLELIVDGKKIPELMELSYDSSDGLTLGASVPCYRFYENEQIEKLYPGLVDAASLIGGTAIQNRASFGGNLCNSSPAADSIPALVAHSAVCLIAGSNGTRKVPVEDFCTGPGKNVLEPNELLVSFLIPPPAKNFGAHYLRFIPRNEMDIAVVGCGASLELDDDNKTVKHARISLGAVAPTTLLVGEAAVELEGKQIDNGLIEKAAAVAKAAARPISDMRGTKEYRVHLAGVLTRRALQKSLERAKGV